MSRTVALTGATGFIGWHVARHFQENGWQVRALVRPESQGTVPDGVERVTTPFDQRALTVSCRSTGMIVHMAARVSARSAAEFSRANVDLTREVACAARALGVRLVHMSSLGATGPRDPAHPPLEDDPLRPVNKYGESKRLSETVVQGIEGLDWTMLRPTLVYGPRDRLFLPLFQFARRGVFPIPSGHAAYNVVHVDDVARAVVAAATSDAASHEIFFVGHPEQVTAAELMARLAIVFGRPFRPLGVPRFALRAAAEIGTIARRLGVQIPLDREKWQELKAEGFVCRIDKARERLGFVAAIDQLEGFMSTAAWYREHAWLR